MSRCRLLRLALISLTFILATAARRTDAQTETHLCSGGAQDGASCNDDTGCLGGVCVLTQSLCDGGSQDGMSCAAICADQQPCVPAYKLCGAGTNAGEYCLRDAHCPGGICLATARRCEGGNFAGLACNGSGDCAPGTCIGSLETSTPTTTPTATPTRTLTSPPTRTPSLPQSPVATRTATATPRIVEIRVGSAIGGPGDTLALPVTISTSGASVVATVNDVSFDRSAIDIDPASCRLSSALGKTLHASIASVDGSKATLRVQVQAGQDLTRIPDGLVYTCLVRVAPSALPDTYHLRSELVIVFDESGVQIAQARGADGNVTVSLVGGRCAGDCGHDGEVTVDELILAVNVALGAAPISNCLSLDTNADGEVTIDEVIVAVGNALIGCIALPTPIPTVTPTPSPEPTTLWVRQSGNDDALGDSPDTALRTISRATSLAKSGYRIVVGPGTYHESVANSTSGGAPQNLQFVADAGGELTDDGAGAVVVDATASANGAGFRFSGSSDGVVDGFVITGANDAAVIVRGGSNRVAVRNCTIFANAGAGIRVQDAAEAFVFNNLIYGNGAQGVAIVGNAAGSPGARVFNNTIVGNGDRGITIGTSNAASSNAFVRNNILQNNGGRTEPPLENIKVFTQPASVSGYNGDFNLVFPATYLPTSIAGDHDAKSDALFEFAGGNDFRLRPESPAINAGDMLTRDLEAVLYGRATNADGLDEGRLDLGFHFAP
jgi:hypothetical protein